VAKVGLEVVERSPQENLGSQQSPASVCAQAAPAQYVVDAPVVINVPETVLEEPSQTVAKFGFEDEVIESQVALTSQQRAVSVVAAQAVPAQ
jgi:hypothetical protein